MFNTGIDNITNNVNFDSSINRFFNEFDISRLLHNSNARKTNGVSESDLFKYWFSNVFKGSSMYMQIVNKTFNEDFSKNSLYRFVNNEKINWKKFISSISKTVINNEIEYLTSSSNKKCYVLDDTTIEKNRSKKTELQARVFDHTQKSFKTGFKLLTLGYSDGHSFIPAGYNVHSSSSPKNILCPAKKCDKRSLAFKRREDAIKSKIQMAYSLIKKAQNSGIYADIVLFDSWFAVSSLISQIKNNLNLDVICRLKKNKMKFMYDGDKLNIKEIYKIAKKRPGKSKYILSVKAKIKYNDYVLPVKIVFVKNNSTSKKDWIAILSTDFELSEEEIIKLYSRRWSIEDFFKVCKSNLKLVNGFKSLSFDALNAHVAIVFTRFIFLSLLKRCSEDKRTMGILFNCVFEELKQRDLYEAITVIMNSVETVAKNVFNFTKEQWEKFKVELVKDENFFTMACQKILSFSKTTQAIPESA